mgnify:FL=1
MNGGQSYSAVSFLGTTNNPAGSFIVGDSAGNLSIATPIFDQSNYQVTGLNMAALPSCPSGNSVANIQTDPSGAFVYIGCYNPTPNQITVFGQKNNNNVYQLPGYTLYAAQISSNGKSVSIGSYSLQFGGGLFNVTGNSAQVVNQMAAVWPGVSPVMRSYPANYPGLQGTSYSQTGAVLLTGLVPAVTWVTGTNSTGPLGIQNSSYLCFNGNCSGINVSGGQLAGQPSQIITAFEIGMDNYGNGLVPAIYTSSFNGSNSLWYCNNYNPLGSGACLSYGGTIYWKDVSPTINSCSIYQEDVSFGQIGCSSPASSSQNLSWPPNGMPAPGNGQQIDITNLTYVPAPTGTTGAFTQGLLLLGTWTNGYLSYHSPANPNASTGLFLNQVNGGNIGNVNSIIADANGNLLFQTGSQGLYAMNPFTGTNAATGSDITLIQQPADTSNGNGLDWVATLADGSEFVYYTVKTLSDFVLASAVEPKSSLLEKDTFKSSQPVKDGLTPRLSLSGLFNAKRYHGQFIFTESQLNSMGLNNGEAIQGIRFRNAEGFSSSPIKDVKLNKFKITLSEVPSDQNSIDLKPRFTANLGKKLRTVRNGQLNIYKDGLPGTAVHPDQSVGTGLYGQLIPFSREYIYSGGNLLVDIESIRSVNNLPFNVDAYGTESWQGLYQTPKTKSPIKLRSVPSLTFVK